jgi:hypothetical protein
MNGWLFRKFPMNRLMPVLIYFFAVTVSQAGQVVDDTHNTASPIVADKIYRNGFIYTSDTYASIVEAVAIKNGKFIAVESNKAINEVTGKSTKIINLKGNMAITFFLKMDTGSRNIF